MRIDVAGGWIDIRERLRVKEERAIIDTIAPYLTPGENGDFEATAGFSPANAMARSAARLVSWSLPDVKPLPVPASYDQKLSALGELFPDVFKAIWDAVSTFESEQKTAEPAEKNAPADVVSA